MLLVVAELGEQRAEIVTAPGLGFVMRLVVVDHDRRAQPD